MVNCRKIVKYANAYIDDELSTFRLIQINLHLLMCVRCRSFYNQLQLVKSTVKLLNESPQALDKDVLKYLIAVYKEHNPDK